MNRCCAQDAMQLLVSAVTQHPKSGSRSSFATSSSVYSHKHSRSPIVDRRSSCSQSKVLLSLFSALNKMPQQLLYQTVEMVVFLLSHFLPVRMFSRVQSSSFITTRRIKSKMDLCVITVKPTTAVSNTCHQLLHFRDY